MHSKQTWMPTLTAHERQQLKANLVLSLGFSILATASCYEICMLAVTLSIDVILKLHLTFCHREPMKVSNPLNAEALHHICSVYRRYPSTQLPITCTLTVLPDCKH